MPGAQLDPGKVKKPIQLLAVMVAGLVLLVGLFLTAAAKIENPSWAAGLLLITAIVMVPLFVGVVVLMWTKFRTHLQDDHYYAEWLKRQEKAFRGFKAENVATGNVAQVDPAGTLLQGEPRRIQRYQDNQGLSSFTDGAPRPRGGRSRTSSSNRLNIEKVRSLAVWSKA